MSTDTDIKRLVDAMPTVAEQVGASGYFSRPQQGLDPHLFGDHGMLRMDVRSLILRILDEHWDPILGSPKEWATLWLAGSGASHQWAADRGNGDLDILIGIDWETFYDYNPQFETGIEDTAAILDDDLRTHLWPKTAHTDINGQTYELTYYVNPLGDDIDAIRAYAAYNITKDRWDVKPPELPDDPRTAFPQADWQAASDDARIAAALTDGFNHALTHAKAANPGSPRWVNALADLRRVSARAALFFDEVHTGRRAAFSALGTGYSDPANFRWQALKYHGAVASLSRIKAFDSQLHAAIVGAADVRAIDQLTLRMVQEHRWPA